MCKIIALSWHPETEIRSAGGFIRFFEILKNSNVPILVIDKYPSIYKDCANDLIRIKEYKFPEIINKFKNNTVIFKIIDRIISTTLLITSSLKECTKDSRIYVPFSELPHLSLAGCIIKIIKGSKLVLCNLNVNTLFIDNISNRVFHSFSDKVITISNDLSSKLKVNGIFPTSINGVGFNPPDYKFDKELMHKEFALYVGRHIPEKGIWDLIDIWDQVINKHKLFISLYTIGDIPEYMAEKIEKKIVHLKLNRYIKLLGKVDEKEKNKYISNSQFCLFPSHQEGWGIFPMEALYLGKRVFAYDLSVYKESIGDHPYLNLSKEGDIEEIAKNVIKYHSNKDNTDNKKWKKYTSWKSISLKEIEIICSV